MGHQKFDIKKLEKLNDPGRADTIKPDAMWRALAIDSPRSMVEIGAGTGFFATHFARMAPGAVIHAADIEPRMIAWMEEHLPEVAEGSIRPLLAEEVHVPLKDGMADVVYMINLHHELADAIASYREAFRLLRPGGRLLVVDWADRETPRGPSLAIRVSQSDLFTILSEADFIDVEAHEGLPWHHLVTAAKGDV